MSKKPFFSVIIPSHNREKFLGKAVRSVLEQTWDKFELIVIDDGSTDGTEELMLSIADKRLKYIKQDNHGVSHARNRALEISSGNFAAFLDSDDQWTSEKLAITARYIELFPDISIFHTEEIWFRNGSLLGQKKKHAKPSGWVFKNALAICCIGMSTSVVKKEVFDRIGNFDETFEACEDYDLWLRASNLFEVKLIPEALTIKHGGRKDQLSRKIWGLDRLRIRAIEKILKTGNLSEYHYPLALSELNKKCEIFAQGCDKRRKNEESRYYRNLPLSYRISGKNQK